MTVFKNTKSEVKAFSFGQLIPQENEFDADTVSEFELRSLKDAGSFKNNITPEIIRSERENESVSNFTIDSRVREHRGIRAQEDEDFERRVNLEVEARVEALSKQAHQEGINEGRTEGMHKAYSEAMEKYNGKVELFSEYLEGVFAKQKEIMDNTRDDAYKVIKNLTKWVILKEVEEKEYIHRLLDKLILEINTKSNLLIKVNSDDFKYMPEVLEMVESKVGVMTNVRVEIEQDMEGRGIILESEVGVIDGTLNAQLASIDKLFESVGIDSEEMGSNE
jgi:flagellar assembly protein FliH